MEYPKIITQIQIIETELIKLEKESSNPKILRDTKRIQELSNIIVDKRKKLDILKNLLKIRKEIDDSKKIVDTEEDTEIVALAYDELKNLKKKESEYQNELTRFDKENENEESSSCIMEIRAGTGGDEANLFAYDLFRMYSKYAENKGWKVDILSKNQTGKGGFKEIFLQITGSNSCLFLKYENGVHRVQRIPVTESSGRIHTSAASVVVYPLQNKTDIRIDPKDLKIDFYRSTGPGGQSVNTTDSAVRITHIPTGIIVTCQDEKSQHKNKKKALSILTSKLSAYQAESRHEERDEVRRSAIKSGDRSVKIRTYNFPQNRITDHRIRKSWYNLKSILEGNFDQVVETLRKNL